MLGLASGCKHKCEEDGGEIPKSIADLDVLREGAVACDFGGKTEDEVMEHLGYVKIYHKGNFKRNALDYLKHFEDKGWERVGCAGGLGSTMMDETRMVECVKKGDKRLRFETYDLDGTAMDLDYLRLKTKEEVLKDASEGK